VKQPALLYSSGLEFPKISFNFQFFVLFFLDFSFLFTCSRFTISF
jgi:hypothetical protein